MVKLSKENVNAMHSTGLSCLDSQPRLRPLIPNKVPWPVNHVARTLHKTTAVSELFTDPIPYKHEVGSIIWRVPSKLQGKILEESL